MSLDRAAVSVSLLTMPVRSLADAERIGLFWGPAPCLGSNTPVFRWNLYGENENGVQIYLRVIIREYPVLLKFWVGRIPIYIRLKQVCDQFYGHGLGVWEENTGPWEVAGVGYAWGGRQPMVWL